MTPPKLPTPPEAEGSAICALAMEYMNEAFDLPDEEARRKLGVRALEEWREMRLKIDTLAGALKAVSAFGKDQPS